MKNKLQQYLRIIISISLLSFLFYQIDYKEALQTLTRVNFVYVFLALVALLGNVYFSSVRIEYLLKIYKLKANVFYLSKLYLIGNFYNNFMPTQIGGDIYKAVRLSKDLSKHSRVSKDNNLESKDIEQDDLKELQNEIKAHSIFAIFMDRFSGLVLLYLIGLIGLFINFGSLGLVLAIFLLISSITGYFLAIKFFAKKIKFINKFKEANKVFFNNKNHIGYVFISALLVQIFAIFTQIFCFWALGINVSIVRSFLYLPIITILGLVPSINGLGIQDAGFVYFFASIGVISEEALAASFLYHLVRFISSLIGGILVLLKQ